jgi:hypothetical protein
MSIQEKCPDEADLCRFTEGLMDEKEISEIEKHLVSCKTCCDYVVSFNKMMHFPEGETLPEVPAHQIRQASRACKVVEEKKERTQPHHREGLLDQALQFLKDLVSFDWLMQPMPVVVKAGAGALLVLLIFSTTYYYYQQSMSLNIEMQVMGKTRVITRGVPTGETIEKILKEGDTLYSNDYCRLQFELDRDAYVYVLYYDSGGKLHQLYPDSTAIRPHKVMANTRYIIPPGDDNWFQLDDQKGTETVFIMASREPITDFNQTINSIQGLNKEKVLEMLEKRAQDVKVLSFEHE